MHSNTKQLRGRLVSVFCITMIGATMLMSPNAGATTKTDPLPPAVVNCPPGSTPERAIVRWEFWVILERCPDAGGWTHWADLLHQDKVSPSGIAMALLMSNEALGKQIRTLYNMAYGRDPMTNEMQFWIGNLRKTHRADRFWATMFSVANDYSGLSNADYVNQAYLSLNNKNPDPSGAAFWLNYLNNGGRRSELAIALYTNTVACKNQAAGVFTQILRRQADSAGLTHWTNILRSKHDIYSLAASLAGSGEFNDKAITNPVTVN